MNNISPCITCCPSYEGTGAQMSLLEPSWGLLLNVVCLQIIALIRQILFCNFICSQKTDFRQN